MPEHAQAWRRPVLLRAPAWRRPLAVALGVALTGALAWFGAPRLITYGEQTTNEMCFVFLGGYSDRPPAVSRPGRGLPMTFVPPAKKD